MTYTVAVCDDEQTQIDILKNNLIKYSVDTDIEFFIDEYICGELLIEKYKSLKSPYDIIFLDMEMPDIKGLDVAAAIRELPDRNVSIAFVTSYPEYMQDSFDVQASQYIIKPVVYEQLAKKLDIILKCINASYTNIKVISEKNDERVLYLDDVICIETEKSSRLLVTTISETFLIKAKLSDLAKELSDKDFISIHRTCLANMKYFRKFNSDSLEFTSGKIVNLSRRRQSEVKELFSKYVSKKMRTNQ